MSGYSQTVIEHMRITILRHLNDMPGGKLNESVLGDLMDDYGFNPSRDRIRTELGWLKEQGLVNLEGLGFCWVAVITARGEDVAKCRVTVPGVKPPSRR